MVIEEAKTKDNVVSGKVEIASLSDELGDLISKHFRCDQCGKEFDTRSYLKKHYKAQHEKEKRENILNRELSTLEKEVFHQKYDLMSRMVELQKNDTRKHMCNCKGDCNIHHSLYNWSRPKNADILNKTRNLLGMPV